MSKRNLRKRTGALDWNDLRTVLAVVRAGSLAGAARALELRHSTVFRRIERPNAGSARACSSARAAAGRPTRRARRWPRGRRDGERRARRRARHQRRRRAARRHDPHRHQRAAGGLPTAAAAAALLAEHPRIEIEADVSNREVDLTRREADLALRATTQPPENLVGRSSRHELRRVRLRPSSAARAAHRCSRSCPGWASTNASRLPDRQVDSRRVAAGAAAAARGLDGRHAEAAAEGVGAILFPTFAAAQESASCASRHPSKSPRWTSGCSITPTCAPTPACAR